MPLLLLLLLLRVAVEVAVEVLVIAAFCWWSRRGGGSGGSLGLVLISCFLGTILFILFPLFAVGDFPHRKRRTQVVLVVCNS